jgi:hypothetical protein
MARKSKRIKRVARGAMKKTHARRRTKRRGVGPAQTRQPFEQDAKRRIGQFGGAGEPPIMQ